MRNYLQPKRFNKAYVIDITYKYIAAWRSDTVRVHVID